MNILLKRKFKDCTVITKYGKFLLNDDLSPKMLEALHNKFDGKYTYIKKKKVVKTIKKEIEDDSNKQGND